MSLKEQLKPLFDKYGKDAVLEEVIKNIRREQLGAATIRVLENVGANGIRPDLRIHTERNVNITGRKN